MGIGFASLAEFLTLARAFEDIGVTAYAGAAPLLSSKAILGYAAQILAAEAEHVANIRLQVAQLGIPTTLLDGVDILPPPSGQNYFSLNTVGLAQTRTPGQVLYIAYGGMANVTAGGFFPNGVNGNINTSSAGVSITNITNAVVTPTSLTTSQLSVVLDASASTSGSGNLKYLFVAVPGGLQPSLLTDTRQSDGDRRLREWAGAIPRSARRHRRERQHIEEWRHNVDLPAVGKCPPIVISA